jgi:hypothetical protein
MEDDWPSNPFAYSPITGPMMAFSGGGEEQGALGEGPLEGGLYDNGLPGSSMCETCGYDQVMPGEPCDVCGGEGMMKV